MKEPNRSGDSRQDRAPARAVDGWDVIAAGCILVGVLLAALVLRL